MLVERRSNAAPMDIDETKPLMAENSLLKRLSSANGHSSPVAAAAGNAPAAPAAEPVDKASVDLRLERAPERSPFKLAHHIFHGSSRSAADSPATDPVAARASSLSSPIKPVSSTVAARKPRPFGKTPASFARKHFKLDDSPKTAARAASQSHPTAYYWPFVLMGYLQFSFNAAIVGGILYLALSFYFTVRRDVEHKVEERLAALLAEIASCRKQYAANRCDPHLRVPAIESACLAWDACMKRNPTQVSRAKLTAETFAEIINSFIEPISYKTMLAFVIIGFGGIALSNVAFWAARSRVMPQHRHPLDERALIVKHQ